MIKWICSFPPWSWRNFLLYDIMFSGRQRSDWDSDKRDSFVERTHPWYRNLPFNWLHILRWARRKVTEDFIQSTCGYTYTLIRMWAYLRYSARAHLTYSAGASWPYLLKELWLSNAQPKGCALPFPSIRSPLVLRKERHEQSPLPSAVEAQSWVQHSSVWPLFFLSVETDNVAQCLRWLTEDGLWSMGAHQQSHLDHLPRILPHRELLSGPWEEETCNY